MTSLHKSCHLQKIYIFSYIDEEITCNHQSISKSVLRSRKVILKWIKNEALPLVQLRKQAVKLWRVAGEHTCMRTAYFYNTQQLLSLSLSFCLATRPYVIKKHSFKMSHKSSDRSSKGNSDLNKINL